MKRFSIVATCVGTIALSISILAQDPQIQSHGGRHRGSAKLRKMDTNSDGKISRDEWKGRPQGFERLDRNDDGTITREEVVAAGREHGKQRIKQWDTNNDRQISRDEWKGNPELFGRLDANNDGVLTREEFKGRRRNQ